MFKRLCPAEPWDIGYNSWFIDYADPSTVHRPIFEGPNAGQFQDRKILRRRRTAAHLSRTARSRAFSQLDTDLARAGAAAPFATAGTTDFLSDQIGCQVHQPIYDITLGELCVRDQ